MVNIFILLKLKLLNEEEYLYNDIINILEEVPVPFVPIQEIQKY